MAKCLEDIRTSRCVHSICKKEREKILSADPRIRVSTIHRAKGGEADNVALLLDSTKACVESEDQDAERRVWYVGVNKSKERVTYNM